jgi:transcription-repair coupling factor (superfamily II helicase)
LSMPNTDEDPWFYQNLFHPLLGVLSEMKNRYVLRETKGGRLHAIIQDVPTLGAAKELLEGLNESLQVGT